MLKVAALFVVAFMGISSPIVNAGMVRTVYDSQGNSHIIGAYEPTPPGYTGPDPWPMPQSQTTQTPPAAPVAKAQPTWWDGVRQNVSDRWNRFRNSESRIDRAAQYNVSQYRTELQGVKHDGRAIYSGVDPLTKQTRYFSQDASGNMTELTPGRDPTTGRQTFALANPQPVPAKPLPTLSSTTNVGRHVPKSDVLVEGTLSRTVDGRYAMQTRGGSWVEVDPTKVDGNGRYTNPSAQPAAGGGPASLSSSSGAAPSAQTPTQPAPIAGLSSETQRHAHTLSPGQQLELTNLPEDQRDYAARLMIEENSATGGAANGTLRALEQSKVLRDTNALRQSMTDAKSPAEANAARSAYLEKLRGMQGDANVPPGQQRAAKEIYDAEIKSESARMAAQAESYNGLNQKKYSRNAGKKGNGPCAYSEGIDGKYECKSTETTMEMAQLGDAMGQVAGSAATQVVGQQQQIKAQGSGSQADALDGAATTSKTAGMAQGAKGMMNLMFGAKQLSDASRHKEYAEEIAGAKKEVLQGQAGTSGTGQDLAAKQNGAVRGEKDDSVGDKIITKWHMNRDSEALIDCAGITDPNLLKACTDSRTAQHETKKNSVKGEVDVIADEGSSEQDAVARKAKGAGIMSMMKGVADAIQAAGNLMAAKEYKKAADKLRGLEGQGGIGGYAPPTFNFTPSGAVGNQGGGGMGNFNTGTDQAVVAGEVLTDPKNDDLGQGFGNPSDDKLAGVGPAPGAFAPGGPQGGGGGGGLGLGGAGSTGSTPQEQEQQAAMAQDSGSLGYSAGVYRGGGGGRSGGGGKDPDISGMMAAMMGKKEEGAKNSILDYGSRGPASMNDGLLSSDTDLFKQVSKRYQQKNQIGAVGLN